MVNIVLILFPIAFVISLAWGTRDSDLPWVFPLLYLLASAVTATLYAWDKHRARRSRRRVSEKTLHFFELLGGWPGALIAQRLLRHKNRKRSYQMVFWLIVSLHLGAWAWMVLYS